VSARDPYAGRRRLLSKPPVDEDRVVRLYEATGNLAEVARMLKISTKTVRGILNRRGVPRYQKPEVTDEEILRAWIDDGTFQERLPPLVRLAPMLGVSRPTANNAVQVLADEGRVDNRRGSTGTFVSGEAGVTRAVTPDEALRKGAQP
jgi:DNA-binding Lrp family transcriptional regulator